MILLTNRCYFCLGKMSGNKPGYVYIYFDGLCLFCNRCVRWLIRRDRADRFRFIALQAPRGQAFLEEHVLPLDLDTIYAQDGEAIYARSSAVLRLTKYLPGLWSLLQLARYIPRYLRDALYNYVARHRYRWWGKYEVCPLPDENIRHKFL